MQKNISAFLFGIIATTSFLIGKQSLKSNFFVPNVHARSYSSAEFNAMQKKQNIKIFKPKKSTYSPKTIEVKRDYNNTATRKITPVLNTHNLEIPEKIINQMVNHPHIKTYGTVAPDVLSNVSHQIMYENQYLDLLSVGISDFSYSPNGRRHNISHSAKKYNGLIIPKGQNFSFNTHLGPVNYSTGFTDANIILNGKLKKGLGGGVCQTSTTVYRAALMAGLPITERSPHSLIVNYYGPLTGLDSAIYPGYKDLRFKNDTNHDILMISVVRNNKVLVFFYGKKDRNVFVWNEFSYGNVYTGGKSRWNRSIWQNGKEQVHELIDSTYRKTK